ncbi:MAG: hypothetical protein ABSH42_17165, partial [Bryobacteraceae bacterium]
DARTREYGSRMPAMRVLVNTPAPQGSTGITTNLLPGMTLGCGAIAGNITSDNVGPLHLINVKRLAYVVRKPEEAFEMSMDIRQAPNGPSAADAPIGIDRGAVVAAVERYLASRGAPVAAPAAGGPSCNASCAAPAVTSSVVPNVAVSVVDRFLARRGGDSSGGFT